jgi:N-acetylmuramic acid 6-phosphate etherase
MPTPSKWESLPTEAINPASLAVDKTPVLDIVDMVTGEDRKVIAAVQKERERIAHGIEIVAQALRKGGRIIFIGAGTSGRLGVVEASEMPPTFGTHADTVQAIMAGGQDAVFRAKEGVEDNYEEGARSISRLRVGKRDVVIGVSASGMTPFVRGGLTRARKAGAKIIFITCWPGSELQNFVDLQIAPAVGPELIAGSTRLKAGTATKMVLNMLTTIAMIKVGKTYGNLMVDVQTGSEKLKDRARRIIGIVTGLSYDDADALLKRAKWNVKAAIVMETIGGTLPQAVRRLKKADDSVREAIGEDIEPRLRALLRSFKTDATPPPPPHPTSRRRSGAAGETTPAERA